MKTNTSSEIAYKQALHLGSHEKSRESSMRKETRVRSGILSRILSRLSLLTINGVLEGS